jgi:hypothetical protein
MRNTIYYSLLIVSVFSISCSKVGSAGKLLTLKGLADEQVEMGKTIDAQDARFEKMLQEYHGGTLDQYLSQERFARAFGDPIYIKDLSLEYDRANEKTVWMYRYAGKFFGSEKIYLYFDGNHNLTRTEYIEEPHGEIR